MPSGNTEGISTMRRFLPSSLIFLLAHVLFIGAAILMVALS
jgi:hypothetical protein